MNIQNTNKYLRAKSKKLNIVIKIDLKTFTFENMKEVSQKLLAILIIY